MKKRSLVIFVIFVILAVFIVFSFLQWHTQQQSIGIIGGSDGPTVIFLTSNSVLPFFAGVLILVIVLCIIKQIKKK